MAVVFGPEARITALQELENSPIEKFNENGTFTATRRLLCPWLERFDKAGFFLQASYPYATVLPEGVQSPPCKSVQMEPYGPIRSTNDLDANKFIRDYIGCRLTLEYGFPNTGGIGGTIVFNDPTLGPISETVQPTAEFITLDHSRFKWGSSTSDDALEPNEAPGKLVRGFDWVLRRHSAPGIPAGLLNLIGTVNGNALFSPSLGLSFGIHQLLFAGLEIERNQDGTLSITYRMSFRPNGWNKFWRAKTGLWSNIYVGTTQYNNYPIASWAF